MARKHTSRMTIKSTELQAVLKEQFQNYRADVTDVIQTAVTDTLQDGLRQIRQAGDYRDRRINGYRQSFQIDMETTPVYVGGTLYADDKGYRLAHLLEYGHLTRNGRKTRAFPHWRPVDKRMTTEFERSVTEGIEKLGG